VAANTILTSIVTGGSNNHATVVEEANAYATDFVTQGVVGAITLNTGSGGTGSYCVNADAAPDMGVTVKAGQAYITATPSGQNSQVLRARAAADYTTYVINANASGSTKYDWVYLSISATNANTPSADGSNVASFVTSRSSSNTTDNGTPPTYGLLLAVITVSNGASSITNANITDKRFNTSIGAQNGSLIVTQASTGTDAIIQAAGTDANVNLDLKAKGTGLIELFAGLGGTGLSNSVQSQANTGTAGGTMYYINLGGIKLCWGSTAALGTSNFTITLPTGFFTTMQAGNINAMGGYTNTNAVTANWTAPITGMAVTATFTSIIIGGASPSNSYTYLLIGT